MAFLPVTKFMGHDRQDLLIVIFVMLEEIFGETDRTLSAYGVRMQVTRACLHHSNFITWITDPLAQLLNLVLQESFFVW